MALERRLGDRKIKTALQTARANLRRTQRVARVVHPSPMVLPEGAELRREPPRAPADRQPDYLERFDDRTLYYDTFSCGEDVVLSGPPMRNLKPWVTSATLLIDARPPLGAVSLKDWGRTQRSSVAGAARGRTLTLRGEGLELSSEVGSDEAKLFAGKKVLVTMSKNNELIWILDWLRFHHEMHGIDAVIIYDNDSSIYRPAELAAAVGSAPGIVAAVVVPWPFPYGPGGGPKDKWDSDFCQYSALEHARHRFLRDAAGVINADVDELVVTADGRSVLDHAAESETGIVRYQGRWVMKVTEERMDPNRQRRFADYRRHADALCTVKWSLIPGRLQPSTQWRVHSVEEAPTPESADIMHRHFKGINNNWKYTRPEFVADPRKHLLDEDLSAALDKVFGSDKHRNG